MFMLNAWEILGAYITVCARMKIYIVFNYGTANLIIIPHVQEFYAYKSNRYTLWSYTQL